MEEGRSKWKKEGRILDRCAHLSLEESLRASSVGWYRAVPSLLVHVRRKKAHFSFIEQLTRIRPFFFKYRRSHRLPSWRRRTSLVALHVQEVNAWIPLTRALDKTNFPARRSLNLFSSLFGAAGRLPIPPAEDWLAGVARPIRHPLAHRVATSTDFHVHTVWRQRVCLSAVAAA
ncbi:hypothetical protein VUR80DRAFT_9028 [Thermomyces stellatus]